MIQVNRGFTLIELLIATTIFLVVVTTALASLLASTKSINKSRADQGVHQVARIVFEQMSRDIRQAKAVACSIDGDYTNCTGSGQTFTSNAIRICAQDGTTNREYRLNSNRIMSREKKQGEPAWGGWVDLTPTDNFVDGGNFPGTVKLFNLRPSHNTIDLVDVNVCTAAQQPAIQLHPFVQFRAIFYNYNPGNPPAVEKRSRYALNTMVSLRNFVKTYSP